MNVLITGHPRSGTRYVFQLLKSLRQNTSFEKRIENGITVSWKHIKNGTFEPPCPETNIKCDFDLIIHQIRHPLKVIASSTTLWTMSINYLATETQLPDIIKNKENTVRNCMYTWIAWNKLIETKANWRFKIEDLPIMYKKFGIKLGIEIPFLPQIGKINSRKHIELTWEDLAFEDYNAAVKIREMATRYGYE